MARNLKSLAAKDIANEFNVGENTVLKWQNKGVPDRSLPAIANYFGVDEWLFTHQGITEEEFKKIILNPKKNGSIKPVFSFHSESSKKDGPISSIFFNIKTTTVLIRAFISGVKGQTFSQFSLTMQGYFKMKPMDRALYPEPYILRLITDESTQIQDRVVGEMIVERIEPKTYYFSVDTPKNFELFVFELEQYTV